VREDSSIKSVPEGDVCHTASDKTPSITGGFEIGSGGKPLEKHVELSVIKAQIAQIREKISITGAPYEEFAAQSSRE
jgi:hypothetical protein